MMRARAIWAAALVFFAVQGAYARSSAPASGYGAKISLATADADQIFPNGFEAPFTLTITNDVSWCEVSIDGGPADSSLTIEASIFPGIVAHLYADAQFGFDWGYWNGTDEGNGYTMHDATALMSSDRSVEVCCPIPGNTDCSF